MSIVLLGSTSGSVTLQEPAVSGTTVLTLPAVSGNVLTDTSPKAGNVLQVLQYRFTSTFSTSSTSFVDVTGFEVTITPSSASNKILVMVNLEAYHNATVQDEYRVLRNGSDPASIGGGRLWFSTGYYGNGTTQSGSTSFLDSPSSTSALTYKLQARSRQGSSFSIGTDFNNDSPSGMHTLTLMEIAG